MYVRHVRTLNWMAFAGEHSVGPLPAGPIAVVGRYMENARRSNWSGKTAWLEAIRFALTGAHRKRVDDTLITHGADLMSAAVEMSTGLVVFRTRPRGGPTVLRVVDGEQTFEREAAEAHLARIIRLPVDDFDNTSWFGQGDVQALCGKTSGVRRETFARWLELDLWERMGVTAAYRARTARSALDVARGVSAGVPPRDAAQIADERAGLEARRMSVGATRDQVANEVEQHVGRSVLLSSYTARRSDMELASRALASIREQLQAMPPPLDAGRFAALDEERATQRAQLDAAEGEIEEVRHLLAGRFDGQCPVMCEACPVAEQVSGKRAAFVERNRIAGAERDRARAAMTVVVADISQARSRDGERTRLIGQMNEVTKRLRAARAAFEDVASKTEGIDLDALEDSRTEARLALSTCDETLRAIDTELGRLAEEERYASTFAAREEARKVQLIHAERAARLAQLVARGLGGSGIPARIAAVSLSGLEARANALLAGLGLSFALTWERELADPAPACAECGHVYEKRTRARECPACGTTRSRKKSDEVDVLVDDGSGEIEDVRAKSGGAKVLVASAIRLAGGMMLRERRGSPLEVAFVDEPFGELDLENRDALARTFAGLLSSVGLEQAFVVSHDAQLLAGLPARIVVTREGSSSRLELEA